MTQVKETILLVEDEPDVAEIIRRNLERSGFQVDWCSNGEEGLARVRRGGVDLAVLDIMLPGMDGRELCRSIRSDEGNVNLPIIMLTSLTEDQNIVIGLGAGADDYVKKPFSGLELVARVKAALRRGKLIGNAGDEKEGGKIRVGDLVLDPGRHVVTLSDETVNLTLAEFRLLQFLMQNPGRAFKRRDLLTSVVGEGVQVIERNIDVHVRNIRRKLGSCAKNIVTVRGIGYRFDPELD
ncbi:MAG: response regulator transcription factor [Planctomycetota bacterium]